MTPETRFKNKVKKFLDDNGCYHVKFFANAYTKRGVPDILACVNGHFIGLELKAENGKPSELQLYHQQKIRDSGGKAYILYPKDFEQFKKEVEQLRKTKGEQNER